MSIARTRSPLPRIGVALLAAALGLPFATVCAARQPDACALVSGAEASHILKTHITVHPMDTSLAGPDAASMCRYASGRINGGFLLLAANMKVHDLGKEIASEKKEIRDGFMAHLHMTAHVRDVHGLGDAAFTVAAPGTMQLHVFAGHAKIVVTRNVEATAKSVSQCEQIARVALRRLGR